MAKKNYNFVHINQSATIVEQAGAAIEDCRNRIMKYDENGNVVLATAGTDMPVGICLIESGCNDITGKDSGKVAVGDDVDMLIKDIGFVLAGATIKKGQAISAGAEGKAAVAAKGNYVIGIAMDNAEADEYLPVQIVKFKA